MVWRVAALMVILLASLHIACSPLPSSSPPRTASTEPSRRPVYNIAISPRVAQPADAQRAVTVRSGTASTLHFGIGPQWESSVVNPQAPNPAIVNSTSDLELTAVLACSFCEEHEAFMRDLVYRASERESTVVSFQFTPRPPTAAEGDRFDGMLALSVFNDATGQEYDRLVVPISIVRDAPITEVGTSPPLVRPFIERPDGPLAADVEMRVVEDSGRRLLLEINPLHPDLRPSLDPLVTTSDGRLRRFRTAPMDQSDFEKITAGAYARTSAISMQGDVARQLNRGGARPIVSPTAQKTLTLSDSERKNLSAIIALTGQELYSLLFFGGPDDTELSSVIRLLEEADDRLGRPVRLHIVSDHLTMPWQYLHPIGSAIDPESFWGLRFDLSVQRLGSGAPAPLNVAAETRSSTVVFARHGSESDITVPFALQQIEQLKRIPVPGLQVVKSGQDFLMALRAPSGANVSAVVAFLHATSGSGLVTNGDPEGPLLLFGDQDAVSTDVLQSLRNSQTREERLSQRRYLSGAPLFIFNACETGPSTIALPHSTFEEVAFQLGAQGIVVTEVSVWVALGHDVGTRLLTKLGAGQSVSQALSSVRRELLRDKNNPLGLLYAYYGDPGATLRR